MLSRLTAQLRTPLYRNGYSLVLSSVATSGLGIIYWILAARLFSTDVVGLNSAVISAIMFLSNIAQFNMVNGLNRFLPTAGARSKRIIVGAYLANTVLGLAAGAIFVLGVNWWTPSLGFIASSPAFIAIFIFSTIAYGVFALQDSALIGIRKAVWVPVENLAFSILKILMLVPFAFLIPAYGILASWLAPLVVAMVVMNLLLFRRLVPQHMEQASGVIEQSSVRHIAGYVVYDYVGSLFWMAASNLQPIIITQLMGASANAYFYLSWQIAYALYLISRNMGSSLIAEASSHPEKLYDYSWRALVGSARLILPATLVIMVGSHYILHLFGAEYAEEATSLLRLLALSAIPQMVIALYLSIARIQRHMRSLIIVQAATSLLALALIFVLGKEFHLVGIGLAWVISQTVVALVLMMTSLRTILLSRLSIRWPMKILDYARSLMWRWKDNQQLETINQVLPQASKAMMSRTGKPLPETWQAQKVIHTVSEVTVYALGESRQTPQALLKVASTPAATDSLKNQVRIVSSLHNDERLEDWNKLLPKFLAEGEVDERYFVIENMLPGIDAREIVFDAEKRQRMLEAAAETISVLHHRTANVIRADDRLLHRWVDERLGLVRQLNSKQSPLVHIEQRIDRLGNELREALSEKMLPVSLIHGDYFPGNILVTPDGASVLGIVDWDLAAEDLPLIDTMHLLLSTRILLSRRELGDIVRGLIEGSDQWSPREKKLIQAAQANLPGDPLDLRSLLLLTWLRHVTSNLTKTSRYASQWLWVTKNIEAVLGNL